VNFNKHVKEFKEVGIRCVIYTTYCNSSYTWLTTNYNIAH